MERRNKDRRANCARRSSRLLAQKPLLGRLHQNDLRKAKDPYSIQAARVSTDHSGASPVASALGIRLGATPRGRNYTNMHSQTATPKGDILTLLEKGTFSLCLDTRGSSACTQAFVLLDLPKANGPAVCNGAKCLP